MKYSNIDRLYKYYAYNKRSVSALRTRSFWFAKPAFLNDPFDCKIPFISCITAEDVKTFLPRFARYKGLSKNPAERELRQVITQNGQIDRDFARGEFHFKVHHMR